MKTTKLTKTALMALGLLTLPLETLSAQAEELVIWTRLKNEKLAESFNAKMKAEGRDVTAVVNTVRGEDFAIKFSAALAAGDRIDVASIDLITVPFYASQNALLDITDHLVQKPYFEQMNKAQLHLGTLEGRHYAAPHRVDLSGLVFNKKVFKKLGIEKLPTTWPEMLAACEVFAANDTVLMSWAGKSAGATMFTLMPFAWANGGSWVSSDGQMAEITHPKTKEMFEFLMGMWTKGCVPKNVAVWSWNDAQDLFLNGQSGVLATGQYMTEFIKPHLEKVDPVFVATMSSDGTKQSTFVGGDLLAVPATTGNKSLALEYIDYVHSREAQIEIYSKEGIIPMRNDFIDDNPYLSEESMVFAEASKTGHVPFSFVYQELYSPMQEVAQSIFSGGDIDRALKAGNEKMQRIIDAGN